MVTRRPIGMALACALGLLAPACSGGNGGGGGGGTTPPPATTGEISGRVTMGGNNVPNAILSLAGPATRNATSNASGQYSFTGLAPGAYTVTMYAPSGMQVPANASSTRNASVQAGQTTSLDWTLEGGGPTVRTVRMRNLLFEPDTVTIPAGARVRWVNEENLLHTVTPNNAQQPGAWQSHESNSNTSPPFEHVFTVSGQVYEYHCIPHTPQMRGRITVQ